MTSFSRTDTSVLGRWWWTVDHWTLGCVGVLVFLGSLLTVTASPSVAARIGLDSFYLARHHLTELPLGVATIFGVSLLGLREIRRLALIGFVVSVALTGLTLAVGTEIKGATRWISAGGLTIQPSEFVKPTFAIVAAWLFSVPSGRAALVAKIASTVLFLVVLAMLLMQPDLGMAAVVSATWFTQFFLAGLPLAWAAVFVLAAVAGLFGAYFVFPHVAERVDGFLDPSTADTYQIDRSLEAFQNGGLTGRGLGEGTVKLVLPDAHSDFIFAVAGEELGLLVCLFIILLFGFIVLRGCYRLLQEHSLFVVLSGAGLLTIFGLQAVINMASALHLMPTKGMTLPFISYGGSSLLALSLAMGMVLALTRRRVGPGDHP
ncbi:MAG: cell division protein FtsW [Rhodospirillaceae bacterium]|nr:cell division protein FtsW [Rhodospirillaceae bacterium]